MSIGNHASPHRIETYLALEFKNTEPGSGIETIAEP